ncbi:RimK family alpha-L-glutamate ligase [Mangrovimicrobium sediminis]|uniref:RimK family alpha-L-glutamate ligase n=1 Tax=Mangrovimicrobium sediminis TaxID=2562682 RepID=A0A4Z0LWJ6_9GAMM|nr:RimK family protein [Haliea sp. SAOS-164]TGD71610.1 RimK family alpha-L-glutamate ligase [Haliea sp. SAOS-164]
MSKTLVVVHDRKDWPDSPTSGQVITFSEYVTGNYPQGATRPRIVNLCRKFGYLSEGYYCSLLAEARGHKVTPSLQTLSDLTRRSLYRIHVSDLGVALDNLGSEAGSGTTLQLRFFFGRALDQAHDALARRLFEIFPCPLLEISLTHKKQWEITGLRALSPRELEPAERDLFSWTLEDFSRKQWRRKREKIHARYDLAILCDPAEALPPSDASALKRFIRAGRELGIACQIITQRDYLRLPEFDGLFIRTTTNIDHYTFRFARKAESEGLVVIDDSKSILRCTNKVYLADLFRIHKVPAPRTVVLHRGRKDQLEQLERDFGYPLVVKIPDGAFSRGVEKANNREELHAICTRLFSESTLLLAQEFLYTDFDWRIGVLDRKPLYACRYYMVKKHWQIYRHGPRTDSGGFDTMPISDVPPAVLEAALAATRPIGDGFYGVDVKEKDGRGFVIEVNDNPSIDSGVEDKYLGMDLYRQVMRTLLQRMEARRGH